MSPRFSPATPHNFPSPPVNNLSSPSLKNRPYAHTGRDTYPLSRKAKHNPNGQSLPGTPDLTSRQPYNKRSRKSLDTLESDRGRTNTSSGYRGQRESQTRKETPDLREFLDRDCRRDSGRLYPPASKHSPFDQQGDFPRSPLTYHDRRMSGDNFRSPLLPPPESHAHTRNQTQFLSPHPRRYSEVIDRRPDLQVRANDYFKPNRWHRTQGNDGGYQSSRGFHGSKQTARMLDLHNRRRHSSGKF